MVNVIIVDDQEIVREGLKMILSLHEEISVIGEAGNGEELLNKLSCMSILPEVILLDIRMPVMDGIETVKLVKEAYPGIKIIILTTFYEDEYIFNGLKNGADGYILKDSNSMEIINSIKKVCEGGILLNPMVTAKVINAFNSLTMTNTSENDKEKKESILSLFTPRELDVIKLVVQGKSNKEIGKELFITEGSVKNYVSKVLEKLELNSRTELTTYLNKYKITF